MREYRLYCLDDEGKSVEARSLAAPSDEEAIRRAAALPGLRQCEVWRGNRLIAKVTDFNAAEEHWPASHALGDSPAP